MLIGALGSQLRFGADLAVARHRPAAHASAPSTVLLDAARATYRSVVHARVKLEDAVDELSRFRTGGDARQPEARSRAAIGLGAGEDAAAINTVAALAGVGSGSFKINDTTIALDVTSDSLNDVLSAINSAGLGVRATYDSSTDKVSIEGTSAEHITPDSNGTGLFAALDIAEATYRGSEGKDTGPRRPVVEAIDDAVDALNDLLSDRAAMPSVRTRLRGRLERAVRTALGGDGPTYSSGFGLRFRFGSDVTRPVELGEDGAEALDAALRARGAAVKDTLVRSRSTEVDTSIFGSMLTELKRDEQGLRDRYAQQGLLVDVVA